MPDLGEMAVEACYSGFRKHCVQVHGIKEDDLTDSQMFLDEEMEANAAEVRRFDLGRRLFPQFFKNKRAIGVYLFANLRVQIFGKQEAAQVIYEKSESLVR